jgi:hypothetical protein
MTVNQTNQETQLSEMKSSSRNWPLEIIGLTSLRAWIVESEELRVERYSKTEGHPILN